MRSLQVLFTSAAALTLFGAAARGQISFQTGASVPLQGLRPDWVATGDFDADGDADFAVSTGQLSGGGGPDWVEVFRNNGAGAFVSSQTLVIGNNVSSAALVAADFDSDGDVDLAISLKDVNMVRFLPNNGSGTFALGAAVSVSGSEPRHMAAGDIDADGDIDLVTSNRASDNLTRLLNDGSGTFSNGGSIAVGVEPRHVALEDYNGDCDLDIAVAAHDSRRIDLLFNTGAGNFGAVQSVAVPGNEKPSGMVAADLDGDGDVDLVSTTDNNNLGLFVVLTNNGGSFSAQTFPSGGSNPDAVVAFDFDADGDKDLAAADENSNLVSVVPNVGGTSFGAPGTFVVGVHPTAIAGTDVDGNGSIDLLVANRDTNNVSLLRNNGTGGAETFCQAKANSVGAGARIDSIGSLGIAANTFALTVRCAPPNRNGVFFYGASTMNVPFGAGRRCVAPPVARLGPVGVTNGAGRLVRPVDFTQPPAGSGPSQIVAGSTWYFQFWYRDQQAGSFTNLSDALSATFNP